MQETGDAQADIPLRTPATFRSRAELDQRTEDAKVRYPSLNFGVNEWLAAFGARPGLFEGILDDVAGRVRALIDGGHLVLDADGHEVRRSPSYSPRKVQP